MDRNGHDQIAEVPFRPPVTGTPGLAVFEFAQLQASARGHGVDLSAPMRPAFHHLIAVRSGRVRHTVDFVEHVLVEGCWQWVRPGQVHWFGAGDMDSSVGTVVAFETDFVNTQTLADSGPAHSQPPLVPEGSDRDALGHMLELLVAEYGQPGALPPESHLELVRHLLSALMLRIVHLSEPMVGDAVQEGTFRRFREAVERDFDHTRSVSDYARGLGYSVRTLTRATRAATGAGAKSFIDQRIVLEAKRLLAHTDLGVAAIGVRLGFSSATVFTKFFKNRTAETPAAFQARSRGR